MKISTYLPLLKEQKDWLNKFTTWNLIKEEVEVKSSSKYCRVTHTTFFIEIPDEKQAVMFLLRWS